MHLMIVFAELIMLTIRKMLPMLLMQGGAASESVADFIINNISDPSTYSLSIILSIVLNMHYSTNAIKYHIIQYDLLSTACLNLLLFVTLFGSRQNALFACRILSEYPVYNLYAAFYSSIYLGKKLEPLDHDNVFESLARSGMAPYLALNKSIEIIKEGKDDVATEVAISLIKVSAKHAASAIPALENYIKINNNHKMEAMDALKRINDNK